MGCPVSFPSTSPRFPFSRATLKGGKKRKGFVTPTEKSVHGDTLCCIVMGPSLLPKVGGWRRLAAVGGSWSLGPVLEGCPSE